MLLHSLAHLYSSFWEAIKKAAVSYSQTFHQLYFSTDERILEDEIFKFTLKDSSYYWAPVLLFPTDVYFTFNSLGTQK